MNPIQKTVTNFVGAGRIRRRKKAAQSHKVTPSVFFNDLENRGKVVFGKKSVFDKWTRKIHKDMQKAGTWITEDVDEKGLIAFVQEYVSRLQRSFWKENKNRCFLAKRVRIKDRVLYWDFHDIYYVGTFRSVYKKIRIFGLRSKTFCLLNPRHQHGMYRSTIIHTHVTRYEFGIEYVEDAQRTYLAQFHNHKEEFHYCRAFGMEDRFQ